MTCWRWAWEEVLAEPTLTSMPLSWRSKLRQVAVGML